MKKILFFMMIMICSLTLGSVYAGSAGAGESMGLYNGITDFSGYKIGSSPKAEDLPDKELYNGVTDFSGYKIEPLGKGGRIRQRAV